MTVNVQFSSIHPALSGANAVYHNRAWQSKIHTLVKEECGGILMSLAPYDRGGLGHLLRPIHKILSQASRSNFSPYAHFRCVAHAHFSLIEKWTLCFRQFQQLCTEANCHHTIVTVLKSVSFHNKLKTNPKYLHHHVNRLCDGLLETLLLFEEDMFHDRKHGEKSYQVCMMGGIDIYNYNNYRSLNYSEIHCQ